MNRFVVGLVSLLACGKSGSPAAPDGAAGSGSNGSNADAAIVDTYVHVHVTSNTGDGLPDPTAIVIFMDKTNTPVNDQTVDANGDATYEMPGGAVTVVQRGDEERLVTFHGVKAGDHLRAGVPYDVSRASTATPHPMTITLPTDATDASVTFECGGAASTSSAPLTIEFYDACRTTHFDLLATHQPMNQPLEFAWQPGVLYQEHGQFALSIRSSRCR